MKIELRLKFKDMQDLNAWFDSCCTQCARCNVECGKNDPCQFCKADRIHNEWEKVFKGRRK